MVEPTMEMHRLGTGTILGGRYRIEALLGRGGMGEVWKAFDLKLQVEVALKSLHPDFLADERRAELLRREVRAARDVTSPHVCRIFDLVELDGRELVSMEYIDGASLAEVLERRGPLELREAAEIAAQLLAGIETIHESGLVHRDLKPDNVMITRSGRVVVMDFGIARALPGQDVQTAVAGATIAGTPAYMSPEQMRGEELDARSDVYATGVLLAEMLVVGGEEGKARRVELFREVRESPPRVPDGPWQSVLARAVAADRMERFGSARDLALALEKASSRAAGDEERSPYPGLAAFTESDAQYYFGREIEVEQIWKKLDRLAMLAVIGPSGVGKSSFLRAGLLPAAPDGWCSVICSPGRSPFVSLAQSLVAEFSGETEAIRLLMGLDDVDAAIPVLRNWRQRHDQVLLVFDQFEELFTLNPLEVQERFADLLGRLAVEADIRVLVSMRDDFFFHCHRFESLLPLFPGAVPLGPLGGDDLRRALVQPALACGYRFEDDALIAEMLSAVSDARGALPLLAFAAARLWESRDRTQGMLTRAAYEETGKVGGALARHAEATLERIGSDHLDTVREIFRNLVTAEGTRVSRTRKEILSVFGEPQAAESVLQQLIDARLLTSYEEHADVARLEEKVGSVEGIHRIEIVHESLLTSWPRLVRWQTQDADGAQLRDQVRQAAQLWEERDRSDDLLWTGTAFREFELWRERYPGNLTETEERFGKAMSVRDRRRRRRRRVVTGAAFVVLISVLALVGVSRQQAIQQARKADASHLTSLGQQELETNNTGALAYAIASLERMDSPQGRKLALEALWKGSTEFVYTSERSGWGVDFSADGQWLALGVNSGIMLWKRAGGEATKLPGQEIIPQLVAFHPEKPWLISCSQDLKHPLQLWSAPDGKLIRSFDFDAKTLAGWGPGGKTLLTATETEDEGPLLWRSWAVESWESRTLGTCGTSEFPDRRTTHNGSHIISWSGNELFLHDPEQLGEGQSGALVGRTMEDAVFAATGPDGNLMASIDVSGEIRLWSVIAGYQESARNVGRHKAGFKLRFGPDGSMLASNGGDGVARLWKLTGPPEAEPIILRKPGNQTNGVAFHPDGTWVAVAGAGDLRLWPLARDYPIEFKGHTGIVFGLAFDPDGKWLASADETLRIRALSPDPGIKTWSRELVNGTYSMTVSTSGSYLVLAGPPPLDVTLFSLADGTTRHLDFPTTGVRVGGVMSPDDRYVAASVQYENEGTIFLQDLETDRSWSIDTGHGTQILDLDFTADGRLVECSETGVRLWNPEDEAHEVLLDGHIVSVDISRDGQRILCAGGAGVFLHDRSTGDTRKLEAFGVQSHCALHPSGEWAATVLSREGIIKFGSVDGGDLHLLLRHEQIFALDFDPQGRWIASTDRDGTVRLWPVPSGTPFHTLPYDELMERLRALTNIRVIRSEESETGYRGDVSHFPGWAETPTW